jgi:hypothetical protein
MVTTILARGALVTGAAIATIIGTAVAASASQPNITAVAFSGTGGPGLASPTVTITGSGFGATAPKGISDTSTSCGLYPGNGDVYGAKLYFLDDANFEAGYSDRSGANCIGIVVVSWTPAEVVLKFGTAYGTFARWYLANGDGYALSIKNAIWGGTVSGLS